MRAACVSIAAQINVTTLIKLFDVFRKRIPGKHLPKLASIFCFVKSKPAFLIFV